MSDALCSQISSAGGEPLAGTAAADTTHWVVLEHDAPWGPSGLDDSDLPSSVVEALRALSKRFPFLRVQLVRRERQARARVSVRVYFAQCGETSLLHAIDLPDLAGLLALSLEAWLRGESAPPGQPQQQLLYLVCVHGKRDRCCALLGLPVYQALFQQVGERALQTTHLGGHRFAATLLTLPHGLCYGRVLPDETAALVAATERNDVYDLARVRGLCAYGSEAQAADVMLRQRLGAQQLDALTLLSVEREAEHFRVRFLERATGCEHEVRVAREALPPAPQSCGAAPKAGKRLIQLSAPG